MNDICSDVSDLQSSFDYFFHSLYTQTFIDNHLENPSTLQNIHFFCDDRKTKNWGPIWVLLALKHFYTNIWITKF